MRYSLMLQLVGTMTFFLVVTAALFAWVQSRNEPRPMTTEGRISRVVAFNSRQ